MNVEEDLYSPIISEGESPTVEIKVHVFPEPGKKLLPIQARTYALEWLARHPAPIVTGFQRLVSIKTDPQSGSDGNAFTVSFSYAKWKAKTTTFSMDTGGETAKRYYGTTVAAAGRPESPEVVPEFYGGINFQNGEFQGIDIPVPGAKFTITACFPWSFLTAEYVRILTLFRGCVNNSPFLFYNAGEVLFLGSSIAMEEEVSTRGQRQFYWRITFNFQASPNIDGVTNNGTLEPISKGGWEAYWVYCAAKPDPVAQRTIQYPVAHYSVQVAEPVNFAALSIPDFTQQEQM